MFGVDGLDKVIGDVSPGANILLIGAPMTGKSLFVRRFLYAGLKRSEAGIYVSTKETGTKLVEWFNSSGLELRPYEAAYGIIDCVSRTLQMGDKEASKNIVYAASAIDMTTISLGLNQFLKEFWKKKQIKRIRVVVESLSNLLMYSNLQTVYRFLHVFTARVRAVDALAMYSIEEGMHAPETITTLKQLVQGTIEVKEEGNKRLLKVTGITPKPTKWLEYAVEDNKIVIGEV